MRLFFRCFAQCKVQHQGLRLDSDFLLLFILFIIDELEKSKVVSRFSGFRARKFYNSRLKPQVLVYFVHFDPALQLHVKEAFKYFSNCIGCGLKALLYLTQ